VTYIASLSELVGGLSLASKLRGRLVEELGVSAEAALILAWVYEKGRLKVNAAELLALMEDEGLGEEELREALIELEGLRALLPTRSKVGKGLAWEYRVLKVEGNEEYEVPLAVYYALEGLASTGSWSLDYAAQRYFESIKEPLADLFVEALKALASKAKALVVDAGELAGSLMEVGLPAEKAGVFISELKGGGFISPLVSKHFLKPSRGPLYELNPLLFKLSRARCLD